MLLLGVKLEMPVVLALTLYLTDLQYLCYGVLYLLLIKIFLFYILLSIPISNSNFIYQVEKLYWCNIKFIYCQEKQKYQSLQNISIEKKFASNFSRYLQRLRSAANYLSCFQKRRRRPQVQPCIDSFLLKQRKFVSSTDWFLIKFLYSLSQYVKGTSPSSLLLSSFQILLKYPMPTGSGILGSFGFRSSSQMSRDYFSAFVRGSTGGSIVQFLG